MFKVREGYVFVRAGKADPSIKLVPEDDKDAPSQLWKLEKIDTAEAESMLDDGADLPIRASDLVNLARVPRDELIDLYQKAFDREPPEEITVSELRAALKLKRQELLVEVDVGNPTQE